MGSLYASGYRPLFTPKHYEAQSMACRGKGQAGDVMHRHGAADEFGDPIEAVGFFDGEDAELKALVADYANGRRIEYRKTRTGSRVSFTTPT